MTDIYASTHAPSTEVLYYSDTNMITYTTDSGL